MLKNFTIKNCYSFADETVFSMEAVRAMKDNNAFVREISDGSASVTLSPVAAIYGSNAGGKSNLINALSDAVRNVRERRSATTRHFLNSPFALGGNYGRVFSHCFEFVLDRTEYLYEYRAGNSVEYEYMGERKIGQRDFVMVFERNKNVVEFGESFPKNDLRDILRDAVEQNLGILLLNLVGAIGVEPLSRLYKWFEDAVIVPQSNLRGTQEREKYFEELAESFRDNPEEQKRLSSFLAKLDPSVKNVTVKSKNNRGTDKSKFMFAFTHNVNNDSYFFDISMESMGVQKLLELYLYLKNALDSGSALIYDELDIMLHPLVFERIIDMFNDKEINKKNAQLIFTAHNTVVMNREDLRRDEIYFVGKDENSGKSHIVRLSEIKDENGNKPRMDASYDRLYLTGMFGAVPVNFSDAAVR